MRRSIGRIVAYVASVALYGCGGAPSRTTLPAAVPTTADPASPVVHVEVIVVGLPRESLDKSREILSAEARAPGDAGAGLASLLFLMSEPQKVQTMARLAATVASGQAARVETAIDERGQLIGVPAGGMPHPRPAKKFALNVTPEVLPDQRIALRLSMQPRGPVATGPAPAVPTGSLPVMHVCTMVTLRPGEPAIVGSSVGPHTAQFVVVRASRASDASR
jgi:hypothetical protein